MAEQDESLAGNPEASAKFFVEQANEDNAYEALVWAIKVIDDRRRAFDNERVLESLGQVLRSKIRIGEGSNLEKDLSGDYARRAGDIQKKTSGATNIPGEYGRIEQKHKDLFVKIRQDIRERSVRDALSRKDDSLLFQFAGERSKTADRARLEQAQEMDEEGKSKTESNTTSGKRPSRGASSIGGIKYSAAPAA